MKLSLKSLFLLIGALSLLTNLGEAYKQVDVKNTLVLGGVEFKYQQEYALNMVKIARDDVATFVDTRYSKGKNGFVFVVAPLRYKEKNLDVEFLAELRNDILKAWLKKDISKFEWRTSEKNIPSQ